MVAGVLALRLAPEGSTRADWLAEAARSAAGVMARKFIAGATPDEALETVMALRAGKLAFTADLLGEAVISEAEADWYQRTCLDMIHGLAGPLGAAPEVPLIDRDQHGPMPRVNLSLKLSSLTAHFEPIHAEASIDACRRPAAARSSARPASGVPISMWTWNSMPTGRSPMSCSAGCSKEPEFRDWPDVGIVVQAYHREAEAELRMLRGLGRASRCPDHDPAGQRGLLGLRGPDRAAAGLAGAGLSREVAERRVVRALCTGSSCRHHDRLRPAFGSHNIRSLAYAIAAAEAMGLPRASYELQTLFGMGDAIQRALVDRGHRVRVYTPYGALLPGMAYLVRRLLENTANESFLKMSSTPSSAG